MQQNQPGLYKNNLSSHASLLLSARPTIITSPLQNNSSNNPQQTSSSSASVTLVRRQSSTPLLASSNLDNDIQLNHDTMFNSSTLVNNEDFINFKKPQNEIFKKLDGKIQKIVAAHSNLNKLYALNDFSELGVGPKRPFELPPQLPPPPPWVPKVANEFHSPRSDDLQGASSPSTSVGDLSDLRSNSGTPAARHGGLLMARQSISRPSSQGGGSITKPRLSNASIESAISKLHQRRQQQQINQKQSSGTSIRIQPVRKEPHASTSASASHSLATPTHVTPAQFSMWVQRIKETLETARASNDRVEQMSSEDKKRFQKQLLSVLTREIISVTKQKEIQARLKSNASACTKPDIATHHHQRPLLNRSSPQTLFNTIRRETSLLLNKKAAQQPARSSLSLLSAQQVHKRPPICEPAPINPKPLVRLYHTIKVIVPPTKFHKHPKSDHSLRLGNYLERESPQPSNEKITIDQFAKCLNLVRANDASLQRHQEQLLESETKWRMQANNRPLRLRRIHGEKIRMPASASYKATRKVGLQ